MGIVSFIDENPGAQGAMAIIQWSGLTGGDTGQPMAYSNLADKTVQILGTIGGNITIEGSNDTNVILNPGSAVWQTLTDNLGNPLSFSSAGIKLIAESPRYLRPNCAAGTTNAIVIIIANAS